MSGTTTQDGTTGPDDHEVDIGAEKIAKVYAQAILEAADRRQCRRQVLDELHAIVHDVLPKVPRAREVFAAPKVSPEEKAAIIEVERAVACRLAATFAVDPAIIGGLVVRIADTVYDHSVATGLVRLGQRLKQRSIHEIQYRRDRLRTP